MNKVIIGQATEEQIKQWKAKYDKVLTFLQTDKEGNKHITYARTPRLPEMQNASRFVEEDPIKSGLILLNDCRLGGSEKVMQIDEMKFGISKKMPGLFKAVEAEMGSLGKTKLTGQGFANDIRKGNALIRHYLPGINPEELDCRDWSRHYNEALWLEDRKKEQQLSNLAALLGGKRKSMADTKTQWILDLKDNMSSGIEHIDKELSQLRKDFKQFETNVDGFDAGGIPEVKNETRELGEVFTEASGSFSEMLGGLVSGDYASVTSGFQGITSGITAMRTASLAFIATPIGAAITALAGIGLAVGAWASYNREAYKTNQIISQITQSEGELTSQIRTRALALQETFGGEWRENVEAAKSLAKSFGISYEEAFDTVEYGLIRGGNVNKEFMDSIREYPKLFEEGGFSAQDFIKTINAGYDLSIYQDKLPDAFKEFGLSVKEQTTASKSALENAFGKTFTNELFTGIKDGSITTREALLQISNQTEKTSLNAQQQAQLTADLFRGAGEDAGGFVEIMKAANVALGDTEQALTATQKHFGAMSELNQELEEAKANALESDGFMAFSANMEQLWTNIKIGWYNVVGFFTNGFSEITKHITSFIATFVQSFTILPMKAKEIFTNVLKEIGDVVSKIMEGANILKTLREDGVGAAWEAGKNWISGIAKEVGDIKKAAVDGAKDIGNTLGKAYMTNYKIANENEESKADAFRLQEELKEKEGLGTGGTENGSGVIPGLSGPGNGGGGKILNMELNITNHFNAANKSKMDIRQMADEIVGVVVDRLRDSSIAFG